MSSCIDILVPHEIVNDDHVTIIQWHAEHGEQVSKGDPLVSLETSKMVVDVEAEQAGYLEVLQQESAEVAIGELIGRIASERPTAAAASAPTATAVASDAAQLAAATAGATISKKAQALIDQHGIDPSVFANAGLVKEADVRAYMDRQESDTLQAPTDAPSDLAELPTPEPEPAVADKSTAIDSAQHSRGLFSDLRRSAQDRGDSILVLAWKYVFFNWFLGNLVRWAPRGVIMVLHRWRGVKMGKGCFIDPTAIVETAYPENITLGDDVRITAGAIIMTHIKAPHYLRDTGIMPAVLQPVVLEDHCFIGVNSVIMPGVTIGKASVVTSGSVVMNNVPPYTMVAGNPAKVIKKFPVPNTEE